jgi:uncharacterized coiled-coil protein SlyX
MLNAIVDLENEIKTLRKQIKAPQIVSEEDVERLEYLCEELKAVRESVITDQ